MSENPNPVHALLVRWHLADTLAVEFAEVEAEAEAAQLRFADALDLPAFLRRDVDVDALHDRWIKAREHAARLLDEQRRSVPFYVATVPPALARGCANVIPLRACADGVVVLALDVGMA